MRAIKVTCSGSFLMGESAIKIRKMEVGELDVFLRKEEPFSDFYCLLDSVIKEMIYTEQRNLLITCIHNYTG